MQASKAAAWNTQELHTWYQKHLHALKVGEHRDRIRSDGISKGVDNSTPRHYHTYLKSKYGIDPTTMETRQQHRRHRHNKRNKNNRDINNNKNKSKQIKTSASGSKFHRQNRSKSHYATPNKNHSQSYSYLPQTKPHSIHNCRVRVPLKEKERMQNIDKQNRRLKSRIANMRPSTYLTQGMMTEHWKRHSQYKNKFLSNRDKVRQYPDVLSRQKLLKSLTAIQSKSVTNMPTCNQSPEKQENKNQENINNNNNIHTSTDMPSVTISSNSVLNVKYSDIMSMHKKKLKARGKRVQKQTKTQLQVQDSQPQIVPRNLNSKHSKHSKISKNPKNKKKTQLPALNSPNAIKQKKNKKRMSHKPKRKNMKVIESTKDI